MSRKPTTFPTVPLRDIPISTLEAQTEPCRPVILVVDDESVIADSLADILKRSGYAAISAYDAETALDTALLTPPELLISDVILPGMNGIELAIAMQRIFPECKVILSSGQSSSARLLANAGSAGHHFVFLTKPVHPRNLLEHVAECLKARKPSASEHPLAESISATGLS
jgi:DNA-binding NtrC family response regulator